MLPRTQQLFADSTSCIGLSFLPFDPAPMIRRHALIHRAAHPVGSSPEYLLSHYGCGFVHLLLSRSSPFAAAPELSVLIPLLSPALLSVTPLRFTTFCRPQAVTRYLWKRIPPEPQISLRRGKSMSFGASKTCNPEISGRSHAGQFQVNTSASFSPMSPTTSALP